MTSILFALAALVAVVAGIAGLVTLGYGLMAMVATARTKAWPKVKGEVLRSKVEEHAAEDDSVFFKVSISYRYKVGERELRGDQINGADLVWHERAPAEAHLAPWSAGTAVDVFYDPEDPTSAVLQPGVTESSALVPTVGIGLVMLGVSIFGAVWKMSGR